MTRKERTALIKSLLDFAQAAVLALVDGKLSPTEAADLIARGTVLIDALKAALTK